MENYNSYLKMISDIQSVSQYEDSKYAEFFLFIMKIGNKILHVKLKTLMAGQNRTESGIDLSEDYRPLLSSFFETDNILEQEKRLRLLKKELKIFRKKSAEKAE